MVVFDELEKCRYVFGAGFPGVLAGEGEADCVIRLIVDVMVRGHEMSIFGAIIGGVYDMPLELPRSSIRSTRPELMVADRLKRAIIDRQASATDLDDLSFIGLFVKDFRVVNFWWAETEPSASFLDKFSHFVFLLRLF